jgi:hypothetical protein
MLLHEATNWSRSPRERRSRSENTATRPAPPPFRSPPLPVQLPPYPIPFLGNLIRGYCHPRAPPPSQIHPRLVRASSTHFGPQVTFREQLAIDMRPWTCGAVSARSWTVVPGAAP